MAIPLLKVIPTTENHRVDGYDVTDEDDPLCYRLTDITTPSGMTDLIWATYRQIFSEHLILETHRQLFLESQLRNRAISTREFIRGLGKSEVYRQLVGDTNSNYRLVDLTFKRFLGRSTYNQDEQIAWSIVIASKGLHGFIDAIIDGDEYLQNFGNDIVPYQRRRMEGRPFNLVNPRYSDYWRGRLGEGQSYYQVRQYQSGDLDRSIVRQAIPNTFLLMAQGMLTPQVNSQRDVARASSIAVPDSTVKSSQSTMSVKRVPSALPYRYIPTVSKV